MGYFILLDLDGTLLTDDKRIQKEDIKRIQQFKEEGHQVAIATGRRYYSAREILNRYDLKLPIIANNGAILRDEKDQLLYRKPISLDLIQGIIDRSQFFDVYPVFHIDGFYQTYDMIYHTRDFNCEVLDYLRDEPLRVLKIRDYKNLHDQVILSAIYFGLDYELKDFQQELTQSYPGMLSMHILRNLDNHFGILEIMPEKVDKYSGALRLAKNFHKTSDAMVTVGDDVNDLTLITRAKVGIAMKNAAPELKEAANFISDYDNNHCGATECVEKFLKGGF